MSIIYKSLNNFVRNKITYFHKLLFVPIKMFNIKLTNNNEIYFTNNNNINTNIIDREAVVMPFILKIIYLFGFNNSNSDYTTISGNINFKDLNNNLIKMTISIEHNLLNNKEQLNSKNLVNNFINNQIIKYISENYSYDDLIKNKYIISNHLTEIFNKEYYKNVYNIEIKKIYLIRIENAFITNALDYAINNMSIDIKNKYLEIQESNNN